MDSALITILTGSGVSGVFCILFIFGLIFPRSVVQDLKEERDALKTALQAERERAETAVAAAQATRDVMSALQTGINLSQRAAKTDVRSPP